MPINGRRFLAMVIGVVIIGGAIYFFFLSNLSPIETPKKTQEGEIFNPTLLSWQEVTTTIPWGPRDSHGVLVFKDKLWLMGGLNGNGFVEKPGVVRYNQAPHLSDIWWSEDGINWNLVTDKALWGKRRSIQAVVFKNKIWLIPGWGPWTGTKNEVWNSQDGIHWNLINSNPNFPPREGHQLVVFQDKLWLIGGVNYEKRETKNDVWYSEDGLNWIEATSTASWSARWDHGVVVFKDKLWLIGGMDLEDNLFGDVWFSEDGKNWSLLTDKPPWPARQGHEVVVFKDKIWIVGRFNSSLEGRDNDVWFSDNGIDWQKTKKNPSWLGREDHGVVVFKDKIWVLGGMTTDWVWKNDIWFSK
jgi:N-acetylneuraminic acid mutarotase